MKPISVTLEGHGATGKVLEFRNGRYYVDVKKLSDAWAAMVDGLVLLSCSNLLAACHLAQLIDRHSDRPSNVEITDELQSFVRAIRKEYEWTG